MSIVLGAVAFAAQSSDYWTQAVLASRSGAARFGNQSLLGTLLRLGALAGVGVAAVRAVWLPVAVAIGRGGTWALARRDLSRLAAYCGLAAVTLLVSPLSWTPHWVALTPQSSGSPAARHEGDASVECWPSVQCWQSGDCCCLRGRSTESGSGWSGSCTRLATGRRPPAVRIAAWVLLGNLYPMLAGAVLAAVHRSAPPSRRALTRRLSPVLAA